MREVEVGPVEGGDAGLDEEEGEEEDFGKDDALDFGEAGDFVPSSAFPPAPPAEMDLPDLPLDPYHDHLAMQTLFPDAGFAAPVPAAAVDTFYGDPTPGADMEAWTCLPPLSQQMSMPMEYSLSAPPTTTMGMVNAGGNGGANAMMMNCDGSFGVQY